MSLEGRKVVVTGGAGFIGSHLVEALVRAGATVTVVDNLSTGRVENLAPVREEVELIQASTLEPHRLRRAFAGADSVFHHAAVLGVRRSWEEPVRVIHENVVGTENVLAAAADAGARSVVLASSSEVYGDGSPPYSETGPASPATGYAAAKLVEEKLAEAVHDERGLRTTCLRYFNVYGPRQEGSAYGFVTAIFAAKVAAGTPPVVFGDGQQTRDFTFVADTVRATLLAAERANGHQVLNVGTGRETTVGALARAVLDAAGRPDLAPVTAPPRRHEVRRRLADVRRLRERLGFVPSTSLADGLASVVRPAPRQQAAVSA